jgi:putative membrane protein
VLGLKRYNPQSSAAFTRLRRPSVDRPAKPGIDPDPRFSLANERTFLAWNRTSLALVGAGLAASQLMHFRSAVMELVVCLPVMAVGAVLMATSHRRWAINEHAMRLEQPLPRLGPPGWLVPALVTIAVVVIVAVTVDAVVQGP